MSSDESVYSEFSVSAGMIEGLAQQACAALGFNHISQARLEIEPATGSSVLLQQKLLHALEANRLEALTVVGWETNERYARTNPIALLICMRFCNFLKYLIILVICPMYFLLLQVIQWCSFFLMDTFIN